MENMLNDPPKAVKELAKIFLNHENILIIELITLNAQRDDLLNEWNIYCKLDEELDENINLDKYWKEKSDGLPSLSKIALFYIWLPVSGVDVEWSF
ncbi:31508_t:CDS:2, partial [Racocetra persica]